MRIFREANEALKRLPLSLTSHLNHAKHNRSPAG